MVVAAGNNGRDNSMGTSGYGTITSPGNEPVCHHRRRHEGHATPSIESDDLIASYSSKGPTLLDQVVKPDLVAPGNRIVSALAPAQICHSFIPTMCRSPTTKGNTS